ncbi:MAG: hypothetical protein H7647_02405 [Candidatus Heimdallarchaeota archaeon]|jgi:hypothetical protein|nr:hypothetical protein [Candidatus Heimdallarchaeota archaeon]MCK4253279.1 hypothetical protein [Candidatus Heimdallarchaeota archaeon]
MNKYYQKRLLSSIFISICIIGVIVGGAFFSYNKVEDTFRISYIIIYVFGCVIVIPTFLRIYWYIKLKREASKPSTLTEIYIDHAEELVTDKEKILTKIVSNIRELGGEIIEKNLGQVPRVIFYFPNEHKYNFFHRTTVKVLSVNEIAIDTMLKADYPLAFSIKRKTGKKSYTGDEVDLPSSSESYIFHSNHHSFYETLLEKEEINNMLINMKEDLKQFTLNRKFVEARIRNSEKVSTYLELLAKLHEELLLKDFDDLKVEEILCYQCDSVFEANEETCDQCDAHRPTCKVCLLDLKPSEKNIVVKTPCCETYAHKKHLITWLELNSKCPNCKTDLFLWLRGLKQNN